VQRAHELLAGDYLENITSDVSENPSHRVSLRELSTTNMEQKMSNTDDAVIYADLGYETVTDYINHAHVSCVEAPLENLGFMGGKTDDIRRLAIFAQHGTGKHRTLLLRHRQYLIDLADKWEAEAKQLREEVISKL
jgi:hypothetical protein